MDASQDFKTGVGMITLHHENGEVTKIVENDNGTVTTSGWYGGAVGVTSGYLISDVEDEVSESANMHFNKVVKIIRS